MKAEGREQKAEVGVVVVCTLLLFGCGQTSTPVVEPGPTSAPIAAAAPEPLPTTISEAQSLLRNGRADLYERGLRAFAASTDPVVRRRALALLGLYSIDQKRWDDAFGFLSDAAQSNPSVAPFLQLRMIDVEVARGNMANAGAIAQQIIAGAPDSSAAVQARLRLPALIAESEASVAPATAAALSLATLDVAFGDAMKIPIDSLTADEFVKLADKLEQFGRTDLAMAIRVRLLTDFRGGRFAETTYRQVAAVSPSPLDAMPFEQSLSLASDLAAADRYDQALDLFDRIARRFPVEASGDAYKSARWRALFNSRHYEQLLDETKSEKLTPPLLLLRARAAWREDRSELFLATLADLDKRFPKSAETVSAKLLRAKYYVTDDTNYDRSLENLRAAIDAGALGNDGENLWTLGWTSMLAGRDDEALSTLDRYLVAYPDADYTMNALFWSGKILDRLDRREEADAKFRDLIARYPFNYFSYRAREIRPSLASTPAAFATAFPDVEAQLASVQDPRLETVDELDAIGLNRDASREMKRVAATYPDNLGIAFKQADIYVEGGEPAAANGILQRRFRDFIRHGGADVPLRFWRIVYPLNYWDGIRAEAAKRNLDPYLVASIIRQESGFEPSVVSNAGAVGLMQIMPPEAGRIATDAGIDGITREKLFDPLTNIAVGTAEYSQKLAATSGNPILAIAAYNAGEEAVGRWLARTPIDDVDLFIEAIPYAETRLYVKTVTRNRFEYRRIYEGSSTVSQKSQ